MGFGPFAKDSEPSLQRGAATALNQSQRLFANQNPVRNELFKQILEGLRTGGIGAQIPLAQRAVGQANQATSQALRRSEASLAGSNLAGTPFGQQILAQQRQAGAQQASGIPLQVAQSLISAAPNLITQTANTAGRLSGTFVPAFTQSAVSSQQANAAKTSDTKKNITDKINTSQQTFGQIASSGGGGAAKA